MTVLIVVVIVAILLFIFNSYITTTPIFKMTVNIIVFVLLLLYVLFGLNVLHT